MYWNHISFGTTLVFSIQLEISHFQDIIWRLIPEVCKQKHYKFYHPNTYHGHALYLGQGIIFKMS